MPPRRHAVRSWTRLRRVVGALVVGTLAITATACVDDDGGGSGPAALDPASTVIVYRFHDSSVAPEYHRSRTVTARAESVEVVVDSYGDVVSDDTYALSDDDWELALAEAAAVAAGRDAVGEFDDECAGGTAQHLVVTSDGDDVVDLYVARCGGNEAGPVELIDDVMAPIDAAIAAAG